VLTINLKNAKRMPKRLFQKLFQKNISFSQHPS
jgi:hypothetical protein